MYTYLIHALVKQMLSQVTCVTCDTECDMLTGPSSRDALAHLTNMYLGKGRKREENGGKGRKGEEKGGKRWKREEMVGKGW